MKAVASASSVGAFRVVLSRNARASGLLGNDATWMAQPDADDRRRRHRIELRRGRAVRRASGARLPQRRRFWFGIGNRGLDRSGASAALARRSSAWAGDGAGVGAAEATVIAASRSMTRWRPEDPRRGETPLADTADQLGHVVVAGAAAGAAHHDGDNRRLPSA